MDLTPAILYAAVLQNILSIVKRRTDECHTTFFFLTSWIGILCVSKKRRIPGRGSTNGEEVVLPTPPLLLLSPVLRSRYTSIFMQTLIISDQQSIENDLASHCYVACSRHAIHQAEMTKCDIESVHYVAVNGPLSEGKGTTYLWTHPQKSGPFFRFYFSCPVVRVLSQGSNFRAPENERATIGRRYPESGMTRIGNIGRVQACGRQLGGGAESAL